MDLKLHKKKVKSLGAENRSVSFDAGVPELINEAGYSLSAFIRMLIKPRLTFLRKRAAKLK